MRKSTIGKFILKSIIVEAVVATGVYAYKKYKEDKNFFKNLFSDKDMCGQDSVDESKQKLDAVMKQEIVKEDKPKVQLQVETPKKAVKPRPSRAKKVVGEVKEAKKPAARKAPAKKVAPKAE